MESEKGDWEIIRDCSDPKISYCKGFAFKFNQNYFFLSDFAILTGDNVHISTSQNLNIDFRLCDPDQYLNGFQFQRSVISGHKIIVGVFALCDYLDRDKIYSNWIISREVDLLPKQKK